MPRVLATVVILCALTLVGPARVLAQEATPAPAISLGEVLDPAECQVEARSADDLLALWYQENDAGTPVLATPVADADMELTSVPVPLGEPADAETVEAVTATVREVLACFNAGDFPRALSLFTDPLVQQFGPEPGQSPEDAIAFLEATPEPAPREQRVTLLAVTDVSVMADGRVGAFVISDDPSGPPEGVETELIVFVEEGGRWLVDGVAEFTAAEDE